MKPDVSNNDPRQYSVKELFLTARAMASGEERQKYLEDATGDNHESRRQVELMLCTEERSQRSPIDRVIMDVKLVELGGERLPGAALPSEIHGRVNGSEDRELDPSQIRPASTTPELFEDTGSVLGPYKLLEQIGEGGMGVVYRARQIEPIKRNVALKIIKPGMDTRQVVARFEAERQALALMDHPHIAKVLDAGATDGGRPFFVMELVKGVSLTDYCTREKLTVEERLRLFIDVCRGVQHAHQKGIIHRDLKPGNILVTLRDGIPVVKIIDFGIAKAVSQELTQRTLFTHFSQLVGTPLYMSPEQAEFGGLDIDTRSDIYSLGVVMYELLTGSTPFDRESLQDLGLDGIRKLIIETDPPPPSHRASTLKGEAISTITGDRKRDVGRLHLALRGELDWIVMKAIEKERRRRYGSAGELADDVGRYLMGHAVEACPPSLTYRWKKTIRRHRSAFAFAAIVLMLVIAGSTTSTIGFIQVAATNDELKLAVKREDLQKRLAIERELKVKSLLTKSEAQLLRFQTLKSFLHQMLESARPAIAQGKDTQLLRQMIDHTAERLDNEEIPDAQAAGELHYIVGSQYNHLGEFDLAEKHLRRTAELLANWKVSNEIEYMKVLTNLGVCLNLNDKSDEAIELFTMVLTRYQHLLGVDHQKTLQAKSNLTSAYAKSGDDDQALKLLSETLIVQQRSLGEEHLDCIVTKCSIANAYENLGMNAKCIELLEQALPKLEAAIGSSHPRFILNAAVLGCAYESSGQLDVALTMIEANYERSLKVYGDNHDVTLAIAEDLAGLLLKLNRLEEAEDLLTNILKARRRTLRANHPNTLKTWETFARLLLNSKRFEEAKREYDELLKALRGQLGEEHAETKAALHNAGIVERKLGNYSDAERLFAQAVEANARASGEQDILTLRSRVNLALAQKGNGNDEAAISNLNIALPVLREKFTLQHGLTRICINALAELWDRGNLESKALELRRELFDHDVALAKRSDASASLLNDVAWQLLTHDQPDWRDEKVAAVLARRACRMGKKGDSDNRWEYFDTLSLAEERLGNLTAALASQKRALQLLPSDVDKEERDKMEDRWQELSKKAH